MARLLVEAEQTFETDFALAGARQGDAESGDTMTYAASGPGAVALQCGTKYVSVHLRLERWDERPPSVDDDWEDRDLLPWQSIEDGGPLVGHGFDPADEGGLDLGDLDCGRIEVLAIGRHRYRYGDGVFDHLPPEQWLLRLWPTDVPVDALTGPPRRIAGPLPYFYPELTPFQRAIHSWSQTGWSDALNAIPASREIVQAMRRVGRPATANELAENFGPWGLQRDSEGPYTWQSLVPDALAGRSSPTGDSPLMQLARDAGLAPIQTFADMLTLLRAVGLILDWNTPEGVLFVPNPAPRPMWEVAPAGSAQEQHAWQRGALASDYQSLEGDIYQLVRWAPGRTFTASLTQIAVRLGLPDQDVAGALRLAEMQGQISLDPAPNSAEPGAPITVAATSGFFG
jgi:hypothetical protein